jgi:DNA-binding XRE family transcriptional regulator
LNNINEMQSKRKRQPKYITAKGGNGIITKLEQDAREDKATVIELLEGNLKAVDSLAGEYITTQLDLGIIKYGRSNSILSKSGQYDLVKKIVLPPERRRIEARIIKYETVRQEDMDAYNLDFNHIREEIILRRSLIKFLAKVADRRRPFYKFLKGLSVLGHRISFIDFPQSILDFEKVVEELNQAVNKMEYEAYILPEEEYNKHRFNEFKSYEEYVAEERRKPVTSLMEFYEAKEKLAKKRIELRDAKRIIIEAKSKELSRIENICYFLFYNNNGNKNKSNAEFIKKIGLLSKTNLEKLIREFCSFSNKINKPGIPVRSIREKRSIRQSKKPPLNQRSIKIKKLRDEGYTQEEVANKLGITTRTVRNYEK